MNITRGVIQVPPRGVIYGPPGLGKTSWACGCEHPRRVAYADVLLLSYEGGSNQIDFPESGPGGRVDGEGTWDASLRLVDGACSGPGDWRSVVIDTADALEAQAIEAVCARGKKASLADFAYGDGFEALLARWRELLHALEGARAKGRAVWLVCHSTVRRHPDPMIGEHERIIPALAKKSWSATHQWADAVLFGNYEMGIVEKRPTLTGQRLLYTTAGSGFEAKNRWSLPSVMPLSRAGFETAISSSSRTLDEVRASIRALAPAGPDIENYLTKTDDIRSLIATETALRKKG